MTYGIISDYQKAGLAKYSFGWFDNNQENIILKSILLNVMLTKRAVKANKKAVVNFCKL